MARFYCILLLLGMPQKKNKKKENDWRLNLKLSLSLLFICDKKNKKKTQNCLENLNVKKRIEYSSQSVIK